MARCEEARWYRGDDNKGPGLGPLGTDRVPRRRRSASLYKLLAKGGETSVGQPMKNFF